LNNEKIDIVNFSEQPEVLISRALSPAKPLDLYIDDDRNYCIAIFDDDDLEMAIGRRGVNINLASNVTGYKIDAFGKHEYEQKQAEQNTLLSDLENVPARSIKPLKENNILSISDLMNSSEEKLLDIKGISEKSLEKIYDAIQMFIEQNQNQKTEEELIDEEFDESLTKDESEEAPTEKVKEESVEDESNENLDKVEL